jgi:putative tryptophan/tyrosine transport system substrate-binding protein
MGQYRGQLNMTRIAKCTAPAIIVGMVLLSLLLISGCTDRPKTYSIGILNTVPALEATITGFKEGMAQLGYIEGKNITYRYAGPTVHMDKLDSVAQGLVEKDVDLILSVTTMATKAVKKATDASDLPVVFVPVTDPVGAGIVDSLRQPDGNITGVTFGSQEGPRLEWLIKIAPEIKKLYVPYNPEDQSAVLALKTAREVSAKINVELMTREIRNPEELKSAIENIPAQADAVFLLPDSLISTRLSDLIKAATELKLPISGVNIDVVKTGNVLTSFGSDQIVTGKQAARLADQIFRGIKPADLPVESAEYYLAINLKVAKAIGLDIPDEILRQANIIVR